MTKRAAPVKSKGHKEKTKTKRHGSGVGTWWEEKKGPGDEYGQNALYI